MVGQAVSRTFNKRMHDHHSVQFVPRFGSTFVFFFGNEVLGQEIMGIKFSVVTQIQYGSRHLQFVLSLDAVFIKGHLPL